LSECAGGFGADPVTVSTSELGQIGGACCETFAAGRHPEFFALLAVFQTYLFDLGTLGRLQRRWRTDDAIEGKRTDGQYDDDCSPRSRAGSAGHQTAAFRKILSHLLFLMTRSRSRRPLLQIWLRVMGSRQPAATAFLDPFDFSGMRQFASLPSVKF
jgi:hypothetical protein